MSSSEKRRCRIGIDVGGTFTDFVLTDETLGSVVRFKEPSVPHDPSLSVQRGLPQIIELAGARPDDVELIIHGTTIGLNAAIQRRGAKLGLVVPKGMRGLLEIGRASLPSAFDFRIQKEKVLVPRSLVAEVSARVDADGNVLSKASDEELDAAAALFAAEGVEAVTVLLLHSFAYPDFEKDVAQALAARLPGVRVAASAAVWPERREYERGVIALMNAYVQPLMESYFDKLSARLGEIGIKAPIYITANNGGVLSLRTARERPIDTILSGPASGVVAAAATARATGADRIATVDMGGTSADMSLVLSGSPVDTTRAQIGEFPLAMPVVGVSAIGAGGGSIVWTDPHGVLKIGPESAGASPGPMCYNQGGTRPTITDCYLTVGLIDPERFLGGRMKLDAQAPIGPLEKIADTLDFKGADRAADAAEAAIRVAAAVMATEISRELAQRGDDARDYALLPFGGAGPTHANLIADEAGISRVIVPTAPGTFCALGAILADVKRDYVSSGYIRLETGGGAPEKISATFDRLQEEATEWLDGEGDILKSSSFEFILDMRYAGQAFELPVKIPQTLREAPEETALTALFHDVHMQTYSYNDMASAVEITGQRLRVIGTIPEARMSAAGTGSAQAKPFQTRNVRHGGKTLAVEVFNRNELAVGQVLRGPVIVEQQDTTIWVLPGWTARSDEHGNLLLDRQAAG